MRRRGARKHSLSQLLFDFGFQPLVHFTRVPTFVIHAQEIVFGFVFGRHLSPGLGNFAGEVGHTDSGVLLGIMGSDFFKIEEKSREGVLGRVSIFLFAVSNRARGCCRLAKC